MYIYIIFHIFYRKCIFCTAEKEFLLFTKISAINAKFKLDVCDIARKYAPGRRLQIDSGLREKNVCNFKERGYRSDFRQNIQLADNLW